MVTVHPVLKPSQGTGKTMRPDGGLYLDTENLNQETCRDSPAQVAPSGQRPNSRRGQWLRAGTIPSFTSQSGVIYKPGDFVFVASKHADQPYHVCTVQELRMTRRDFMVIIVKCFYRPSEVPDSVYQPLVQDRHHENSTNQNSCYNCLIGFHHGRHFNSSYDLEIQDPLIRSRELFISHSCDTYPASSIRGKCTVLHYQDIFAVKDFQPLPDTFFYIFGYNSATKRLATTQGEIRVGPSHQARLPLYQPNIMPANMPEKPELLEKMLWQPSCIVDGDLMMYLRAARSMAAYAGMCNGGSTEEGFIAASLDETTANALNTLHTNSYDTGKSLQALVRYPVPKSVEKKWNEEESKRFVKGLRQYGKNFFKIRRELLQHKETTDLVEYYYYWKKTPAATTARPHRRHRRQSILRRQTAARSTTASRPASCEFLDLSSASEVSDVESGDDSDSRDLTGYACRHCFTTTSKDWHHAGKDRALLCTECRLHFKKYGEERPVDKKEPPPFLFKPVVEDEALAGKHTMRTRRNRDSSNGSKGRGKKNSTQEESSENIDSPANSTGSQKVSSGHQSPSTVSTCSNSSTEKEDKKSIKQEKDDDEDSLPPVDVIKKRRHSDSESDDTPKKKKERSESLSDSISDSSSICNDENQVEDGETNQDELMSCSSPSPPVAPSLTPVSILAQNDNANHAPCESPIQIKQEIEETEKVVPLNSLVATCAPQTTLPIETIPSHPLMQIGLPYSQAPLGPVPLSSQSQNEARSPSSTPSSQPSPSPSHTSLPPSSAPPPLAPSMNQPPSSLPMQLPPPSQQLPPPPPLVQQPLMMPTSLMSTPPPLHPDHLRGDHLRLDPHRPEYSRPDSMRIDPMRHEHLRPDIRPEPIRPDALRPDPVRPDALRPDPMRSDLLRPELIRPDQIKQERQDTLRPGPLRPDALPMRTDSSRHDPMRPESFRPDSLRGDPMRTDSIRPDTMRPDLHRPDPTRSDSQRHETMRSDTHRPDQMRSDSHRSDPIRPDTFRPDPMRLDALRSDPMRTESMRPDPMRPESHRPDQMRGDLHRPDQMHSDSLRDPLRDNIRPDTLRPDPMRPESLRTDQRSEYRPDSLRTDSVRTDQLRMDSMRSDSMRTEPLRGEPLGPEHRNDCTPDRDPYESPPVTPEPSRTPSPGPDPIIVNEDHHKSTSALFIKILSRGESNSCSRCDLIFRPTPDSKLARRREERQKRAADTPVKVKEEVKDRDEKCAVSSIWSSAPKQLPPQRRAETPPPNQSADAQITSSFSNQPSTPYGDRHTPRQAYPGHDTPALRQLSEYARPHALGQEIPRTLPYSLASMPPSMDPMLQYRMASMYPPGSRERLELDLEREKRERDAREREIRERELREMELREKMKAELEMKPPGFDRLPPTGNPIDSHWLELQRRYAMAGQGGPLGPGGHPGGQHIPGVYPPSSLASDLLARERERLERMGIPMGHPLMQENPFSSQAERLSAERLQAERMALATDPMLRLQMAGMSAAAAAAQAQAHQHTHAHAHTHLHLHGQDENGQPRQVGPQPPPHGVPFALSGPPFSIPGADPLAAGSALGQAAAAAAAANHPLAHHPYGHAILASREREMLAAQQHELLSRQYDPALAHQLSAQAAHHEAIQRQLAMERDRLAGHSLPH
ncbi:arginine-glutamic acid dipeptide repeats protein-like [Lineus longissimus]|uniref:arginine-glutamic acid dipeptide repeats protein-like n=1 Tax=Lineus longissimus TaxID=88925 RepID=UPI00315DF403